MKKVWILVAGFLFLVLMGCADGDVIHEKANLIVTNYSDCVCEGIAIKNAGSVVASSRKPIGDTQLCYFNIDTDETYYEFEVEAEFNGEHFTEVFAADFSHQDEVMLIGVNYRKGSCEIFIDQKEGQ